MKKRYHLKKEVKEVIVTELCSAGCFILFAIAYIMFA